jgi:hypothetical protein
MDFFLWLERHQSNQGEGLLQCARTSSIFLIRRHKAPVALETKLISQAVFPS